MSRVLVVDDEPIIRSQLCDFLRRWSIDTVGVGNLMDAENEMARGISVIIQDLVLKDPDEDVYSFMQKHCGPDRPTEVIAITAHLAKADLRRVVDAGAFCFLKKPLDFDELLIATWAALLRAERRVPAS